ncbi:MAG TPA: phosphonatase-like hydrolase [Burkholderiales bacterium]|nr:phosphonatase-like hydrolase [Burkholderiales bacterium]
MRLKEIRLVVSDMAGTTVKDSGEVARAFTAALADHGVEASAQQINAVRGASKREAIATLVAPKYGADTRRVEAVYASFKNHLQRVFTREAEPVAGAVETFDWLRNEGIKLVLNTGFDRDITDMLIDALGWRSAAAAVICGDDVPQGRPAPYMIFRAMEATAITDVRQVLNVGDTVSDLQAARNAGVAVSVGVLSGAHSREQLAREVHTCLIDSIAELPALWGAANAQR